jgi:uncharacterized phage infection (PIP) family protein YhgE
LVKLITWLRQFLSPKADNSERRSVRARRNEPFQNVKRRERSASSFEPIIEKLETNELQEIHMDRTETQIEETIAEDASTHRAERVVNFPVVASDAASDSFADGGASALDLVSEAAEAIKGAEDRAATMMARAQSLASSATQKVRLTQARIERAEATKRQAEADLAGCRAEIDKLRNELKQAEATIADKSDELAAAEQRSSLAEQRATEMEGTLGRVMHAIRTQFPKKNEAAAVKSAAAG